MMPEISLNILDVAENSVRAQATLVEITVETDIRENRLRVWIKDNGCGMSRDQLEQVTDPFFTTRRTRKVGLGVPFFKMAALSTGGDFQIMSEISKGTEVYAEFVLDTRQMREILGGIPLDTPEVAGYIRDYLEENKKEVDGGAII